VSGAPAASAPAPAAIPVARKKRILIDPGHGGKDPGATGGRGTEEKDINLLAAKQLAKLLTEEGVFDVRLTRTDDTFIPLSERSRMANDWPADLFVSLHCNASKTSRDEGFEVYFESEHATDPQAEQLADFENSSLQLEGKSSDDTAAQLLLGELSKTEYINSASQLAALMARDIAQRVSIGDRGVKQAGFYVLRGTHAPAVLFEMAYVTNPKDEVRLQSARFRRKLVDGVYAGILDYAKRQGWLSQVAGQ
jgi:N-acetylmuramoyl-L-alanine amidase